MTAQLPVIPAEPQRETAGALSDEALAIIERTHLAYGAHDSPAEGMCAMELVAFVAGEPFSDHPECVCPVLGAFVRAWNDGLPDAERDAILKPILPRLIGTRGSAALAERRALMAADWLVRVHTPIWLRLAKLDAQAAALAALPEITAMAQVPSIRGPVEAAQRDASAARSAAESAARSAAAWWTAWSAAESAALSAARSAAAWSAAESAALSAAESAAWSAAGSAAESSAWWVLETPRLALQRSAGELVIKMVEVADA